MQGHGSYELSVINQIVIAKIMGSWNKEKAEQYFTELKSIAHTVILKPWAMVVYMDKWELGTPGSDEVTLELIKWLAGNNLNKVAEIYSPSALKKMHVQQMINKTQFTIDRMCFHDDENAFVWLASHGFTIEPTS